MRVYRAVVIFNGKILLTSKENGPWDLVGDFETDAKMSDAEGFLALRQSVEEDFSGITFLMDQSEKAVYAVNDAGDSYVVCTAGFSAEMSVPPRFARPGLQAKWFKKDELEDERLAFIARHALGQFSAYIA
jgi:hypothetical protein